MAEAFKNKNSLEVSVCVCLRADRISTFRTLRPPSLHLVTGACAARLLPRYVALSSAYQLKPTSLAHITRRGNVFNPTRLLEIYRANILRIKQYTSSFLRAMKSGKSKQETSASNQRHTCSKSRAIDDGMCPLFKHTTNLVATQYRTQSHESSIQKLRVRTCRIHADPFVCTYWPAYLHTARMGLNCCSVQQRMRTTVKLLSREQEEQKH